MDLRENEFCHLQTKHGEQKHEIRQLKAELAQLRMAVGLATTIKPDMEVRSDDPVGMMQEVEAHTCRLKAELEQAKQREARLRGILKELNAVVRGECPSLLNEDSGGDSQLAMEIAEALQEGI